MVNITIDGKKLEVEEGTTILQAAEKLRIKIPTLCYYKALSPQGACRLCVVEIVGGPRKGLSASCSYVVEEGLEVKTNSDRVIKARKLVIELLLLRCPDVPKIKELAEEIGIDRSRYERFQPNEEKCVLCGLCVRVCQELMGVGAINFINRGSSRIVSPPFGEHSSICVTCGACEMICPTGAINLEKFSKNKPLPISSVFDEGLVSRPSIYSPFPQAVPKTPVIDRTTCMHFLNYACKACESFCEAKAIKYKQEDEIYEVDVGAIILTPGFEKFNPQLKDEYGHGRMKNVLTSIQFERVLSSSGPYQSHVIRPSDHKEPKKIAWIQCVGSRDSLCGNEYCSSVCCMYATKEAIMAVDHVPGLEASIFYNDIRAFGKGFEFYYESAKNNYGVRYVKGIISGIKELQQSGNLLLTYTLDNGEIKEEEFDIVVLSVGLVPHPEIVELAKMIGINVNRFGFCQTQTFTPNQTSRPGIYVAGAYEAPMDIPETVMGSSSAAALAGELLSEVRGSLVREKTYPQERDISKEEPRVGVFVCRCGTNIARVVDVPSVADYAKTLPFVAYAEENLYTCSTDTQLKIINALKEHQLNRVVVASCSPRTHEPLFQDTLREAGLNKYLFEMANIRDQCSWVHAANPKQATEKANDLVRMAVARATRLEPIHEILMDINQSALIIGGGVSGMTAALSLAEQGFDAYLIEKEKELGGNLRNIFYTLDGQDPKSFLENLIDKVKGHPKIKIFTEAEIEELSGFVGKFKTRIRTPGKEEEIAHGVVILATGAQQYHPTEYGHGSSDNILTQLSFEEKLAQGEENVKTARKVVMIQCVGSRDEKHPFCSRICCTEAIKNALKLKEMNPEVTIYILYRDIRTYGFNELYYKEAREKGVVFVRYEVDRKPVVNVEDGKIKIKMFDEILNREILLNPDYLILSAGIHPRPDCEELAAKLKLPLNADKFFLEAHMKLRPLDFSNEGFFMAGLAHSPKFINESIAQARGTAARAVTIISQNKRYVGGAVSVVDQDQCAACLTCVRECPFHVPAITEEGVAYIEPAACQGCGICASACPRKAIDVQHYKDNQIIAECEILFDQREAG
ncbi:MAG: FAD-dependent oxidoreductase [Thermodesulfobacteriota bacterium]|nr:MAG: FAD-dependent oxidoreductase [Thermodesulfobacteriota bacterium]